MYMYVALSYLIFVNIIHWYVHTCTYPENNKPSSRPSSIHKCTLHGGLTFELPNNHTICTCTYNTDILQSINKVTAVCCTLQHTPGVFPFTFLAATSPVTCCAPLPCDQPLLRGGSTSLLTLGCRGESSTEAVSRSSIKRVRPSTGVDVSIASNSGCMSTSFCRGRKYI